MQDQSLFYFFVTVLKNFKRYVAGLMLAGLFFGLQTSLAPYALKLIIDNITVHTQIHMISYWAALYVGIFFLGAMNLRVIDYLRLKLFPALRTVIIRKLYTEVQKNSMGFFRKNLTGSVANRISNMSSGFINVMSTYDIMFANGCALLIATAVLFSISFPISMVLFFWSMLFFTITLKYTTYIQSHAQNFFQCHSHLMGHVVDSINNIKNVWFFNNSKYEIKRVNNLLVDTQFEDTQMQHTVIKLKWLQDISIFILMSATMYLLLRGFALKTISSGDIVFTLMVLRNIVQYTWNVANQWTQFSQEIGKCKNALSLVNAKKFSSHQKKPLNLPHHQICFDHVCFSYPKQKAILDQFQLLIPEKQSTAIVGLSGSGKSTLLKLLIGFHQPQAGMISIGDTDIQAIPAEQLRQMIAIVSPDMGLFNRTVKENIQYGNLDATEEEIIEASEQACCHDFIMSLPKGYDTVIGEKGESISTGQMQRITLARAILKDAPIILLDEATSALDPIQTHLLHKQLAPFFKDRTCLVITHQIDWLHHMDNILVFDRGAIIESGKHTHLIQNQGHYASMWQSHQES